MRTAISSTEAARNFSRLLDNIKYRGERYAIVRRVKVVATLGPVEPVRPVATLADLRDIIRTLPGLDGDDKNILIEGVQLEVR